MLEVYKKMMYFNEYQTAAKQTAIYPPQYKLTYPLIGLLGEAGELANKYKKVLRDKSSEVDSIDSLALANELGDVLWYTAMIAEDLGYTLSEIADMNLKKLAYRKNTGTLQGSGDNR